MIVEPTFILAIENELDRLALENLIVRKFNDVKLLNAESMHDIHKHLFTNDDAVIIIHSDYFENHNIKQSLALTLCFPNSKWLILCNTPPEEGFIGELINENRILNIILHSDDLSTISEAILATLYNRSFITEEVQLIIDDLKKRKKDGISKRNLLTSTENEIVQLIIQGKTAKEIAELRCLSFHTVNTHRKNIFRKLEINSVQELIKYSLKMGLMDLTEYYI